MNNKGMVQGLLLGFAASTLIASAATAATQAYVAKNGADTGACPGSAPCLTLTYALTQVSPNGQVIITGSGIYEPITIAQPVSIFSEKGVSAFIYSQTGVNSNTGVIVNNATTDDFKLIGINVISNGSGTVGIQINSARRVELRNLGVRGFSSNAVSVTPAAPLDLIAHELTISGNSGHCMFIKPTGSGTVNTLIKSSRIDHCGGAGIRNDGTGTSGITATGPIVRTQLLDSTVSNISTAAILSVSGGSDPTNGRVNVLVENSLLTFAATGAQTIGPNAYINLKGATITGTTTAVNSSNSTVFSYMDSMINFNASNGTATVQVAPR